MGLDGMSIGSILIILLIVVLLFGTKKLRSMGGDLGHSVRSFREAMRAGEAGAAKEEQTVESSTVARESPPTTAASPVMRDPPEGGPEGSRHNDRAA